LNKLTHLEHFDLVVGVWVSLKNEQSYGSLDQVDWLLTEDWCWFGIDGDVFIGKCDDLTFAPCTLATRTGLLVVAPPRYRPVLTSGHCISLSRRGPVAHTYQTRQQRRGVKAHLVINRPVGLGAWLTTWYSCRLVGLGGGLARNVCRLVSEIQYRVPCPACSTTLVGRGE
jgi:hypothetical protein